jgi:UDP-N-acetylmuramate dehydrogenase
MMSELQRQLNQAVQSGQLLGLLKNNESMSRYTTWRIGGNAECIYQPETVADLQMILKMISDETPVYWIGLGSNLLIRDGGLKGLVINTNGVLNNISIDCLKQEANKQTAQVNENKNNENKRYCWITAQAGLACAIFSRKAANEGISGAEFLSGIPGTIGGALAMNAGAFGGETWRYVESVEMINHEGDIIRRTADEFEIQYRHIELKQKKEQEWFLSGTFRFEKDEQGLAKNKQEIKRLLARRAETQPTKQANAGSVFKNPDNDYAARLIESCGMKGESINDAQISEKHANFIINKGNARASDVEALIKKIKKTVMENCNVALETEVHIIGEPMSDGE